MRVLQQTTQTGSVWDCPAGRSNEERGTEGDEHCSGEIFNKCVSVKKPLSFDAEAHFVVRKSSESRLDCARDAGFCI